MLQASASELWMAVRRTAYTHRPRRADLNYNNLLNDVHIFALPSLTHWLWVALHRSGPLDFVWNAHAGPGSRRKDPLETALSPIPKHNNKSKLKKLIRPKRSWRKPTACQRCRRTSLSTSTGLSFFLARFLAKSEIRSVSSLSDANMLFGQQRRRL